MRLSFRLKKNIILQRLEIEKSAGSYFGRDIESRDVMATSRLFCASHGDSVAVSLEHHLFVYILS